MFPAPPPGTWVSAVDGAALHAAMEATRWLGGEERLFLSWALRLLVDTDALKLGVPVLLAFWVWARPAGYAADPLRTLRQIAGVGLAMAVGRGAQILLPERPRPMQAMPDYPFPDLGHLPVINDGSAMPSDHAALSFALAAVVWSASRRWGALALLWAAAVTCFPRLYFGYHQLSDLAVGAAVGVLAVRFALRAPLPSGAARSVADAARAVDARAPGLATVALFIVAFECMTLFWSSRRIANATVTVAAVAIGKEGGAGAISRPAGAAEAEGGACDPDRSAEADAAAKES